MSVLVDYRGFRLIAMSTLPITDATIIYGSSNASKECTVHTSPKAEKHVERLANHLNLKKHSVGPKATSLWTPIDLEVHEGLDGKIYLLDFSRLFPPVEPDNR